MTDTQHNEIVQTRGCFDIASSEYNELTMDEKVQMLKELINDKNYNTANLALQMMDIYNTEYNKGIRPIDLVAGLGSIIDHLLKEK